MTPPDALVPKAGATSRESRQEAAPEVGAWYVERGGEGRLVCVTHVGSNYVEVEAAGTRYTTSWRIHADEFHARVAPAPDAADTIQRHVEGHRAALYRLMAEARELSLTLGLAPRALGAGPHEDETQALVAAASRQPVTEYKAALIKAREETLPAIFEAIKQESAAMAAWLKAPLIALEAEADGLKPAMAAIEARVFNVELYAGLTEEVVQIRTGDPAPMGTTIHLFQRRHYMDEESLVDYRHGGMEFKDLRAFDRWMAEPAHFERLLPHPRSVIAMQVRRDAKERDFPSLSAWIAFHFGGDEDRDRQTFLYLRNGDQLFRLQTGIAFDAKLFPDLSAREFDGQLYAEVRHDRVEEVLTEAGVAALRVEAAAEGRAIRAANRKDPRWAFSRSNYAQEKLDRIVRWDHETVYYDDITAYVNRQIEQHNRIALVLQGLLDRSPVFHPHPPWRLYAADGFDQAVVLVYDVDRGLTSGAAPDFEVYRARLNATLRVGAVTVGQDDYWREREAEKMNAKDRSGRGIQYRRYVPSDDPGPGVLARVAGVTRGQCTFTWTKPAAWRTVERRRAECRVDEGEAEAPIPRTLRVPRGRLLNADAYRLGDFRQFFADPRTRAAYLQWAPYLLEAEEYQAGGREGLKGKRGRGVGDK